MKIQLCELKESRATCDLIVKNACSLDAGVGLRLCSGNCHTSCEYKKEVTAKSDEVEEITFDVDKDPDQ